MKKRTSLMRIFEAEDAKEEITQKPGENTSVDRQILRYIMDAERTAVKVGKGQQSMTATESLHRASMQFLLEAEGDDPSADSSTAAPASDDQATDEKGLPPLDVGVFATEIMRVVKNYDTLLDIPSVVVNRAIEYVTTKYDKETAESFTQTLRDDFDYEPAPEAGPTTSDEDDNMAAHFAVGARAGGGTV